MSTSRTKNSLHNTAVAMGYYLISFVLQFFSRKVFLECLGTEILGLNTTAMNLLQFLNLAELGISAAVGFMLYKPLYDKNISSVREIVTLQGKMYARIACIIIAGACVLMLFFPLIFGKIKLPLWYAYASFGVLLFSALLGYFVNFKQVVLSANQQDYKILYSYKSINLIKILCQMAAVYYMQNGYVWWLVLEVVFAIIASVSLHIVTIREFPGLTSSTKTYKELKNRYPEFTLKIKQLFFHRIGSYALTQTSPLIVYAYTTLTTVALYGNYLIIISGLQVLGGSLFNSINASVGNLVAEGNKEKSLNLLFELFSVRFLMVSTMCYVAYMLTPDLISLWIGPEYVLPKSTLLLLICSLFINTLRYATDAFINSYGLFSDIWSPIIEATINISFSILFGYFWGLNGVLSGVLLSQIIIIFWWKPYFLFTSKFPGEYLRYCKVYLVHSICGTAACIATTLLANLLPTHSASWLYLILRALTIIIIFTVVMLLSMMLTRCAITRFLSRLGIRYNSLRKKD